jgi:hypothetical protein
MKTRRIVAATLAALATWMPLAAIGLNACIYQPSPRQAALWRLRATLSDAATSRTASVEMTHQSGMTFVSGENSGRVTLAMSHDGAITATADGLTSKTAVTSIAGDLKAFGLAALGATAGTALVTAK